MGLEISLDNSATSDEVAEVEAAFREAGFEPDSANANYFRKSIGDIPWQVWVIVSFGMGQFFGGFLGAAGQDSWKTVKGLVRKVYDARRSSSLRSGSITVRSNEDIIEIHLHDGLPDIAYVALFHVAWEGERHRILVWDDEQQQWWDPTG